MEKILFPISSIEVCFSVSMVTPTSDVIQNLDFGNKEDFFKKQSKQFVDFFLYSPSDEEKEIELVLYWEGWQQSIPNDKNLQKYFEDRGFKFPTYHPSVIVECKKESSLFGVKWEDIDIILPSHKFLCFKYNDLNSFLTLSSLDEGKRSITFTPAYQGNFFDYSHAFLLEREK